jgi:DNA-binding Lrp family transcriptional regulator
MTQPISGRSADLGGAHRVDDPDAAKLLVHDGYRAVLDAFVGRERSVAEAAEELRLGLDATLYRVRRLHRAGVLVHSGTRARAGRPVKLYRAAHDAWFVPFEALPYADLEETFLELHIAHARVLARAAARALRNSAWSGYRIERGDDGQLWMRGVRADGTAFDAAGGAAGTSDAMVELRLAPDDALQLNQELAALVQRYAALDRSDEGPPNRIVLFASVPLAADR